LPIDDSHSDSGYTVTANRITLRCDWRFFFFLPDCDSFCFSTGLEIKNAMKTESWLKERV